MDVLDNYKKAWDNQPEVADKVFSKIDIYKMAHSRSSSIVKWIFIIGMIEFVIAGCLFFIDTDTKIFEEMEILWFYKFINILGFIVMGYFIIKFYLNYKKISASDDTKTLMTKILKTRKTVRNYIFVCLFLGLSLILIVAFSSINHQYVDKSISEKAIVIIIFIIVGAIFLTIIWFIYQLIYGILLRKLNRNYKELAKLDELN